METAIKSGLRKIGLRFDAFAALFLCQMYDVEIAELGKIPKDEYFASYVWCAYRSYMTFNNKKSHITYKGMKRRLEKLRVGEYYKINKAIREAAPPVEKGEGSSKKKRNGKTTS